jgi:putative Mn2+ efflux pump MntP
MPWAKLIFIGTATNLDNMGIGVAYGLKRKAIPFLYNLIIAFISALVTFFAVISGGWLRQYISQNFADLSGGILIIFLGLYTLWQSRASATDPALQTLSTTETMSIISWQESIVLGFT